MSSPYPQELRTTNTGRDVEDHGVHYVLSISLGVSALALIVLILIFAF